MKAKKIDKIGYELESAIETLHKKQETKQKNGVIAFSSWLKLEMYLNVNRKNYSEWLEEKIAELPDIKLNN